MGAANIGRQVQETIIKNTARATYSTIQNISAANNIRNGINQNVTLNVQGTFGCGTLTINNDGRVSASGVSQVRAEQITDITTDMEANFQQIATAELEQVNSGFNLWQFNIGSTVQRAITETKQVSESVVEQSIDSTNSLTADVNQNIVVTVGKRGELIVDGDCLFNNVANTELVAENIVEAYMETILATDIGVVIEQGLDSLISQENEGIDITIILIIVGVILGVIVIVGVTLGVLKAQNKAPFNK
jgi:hypothetical protein